jgi:aminoglycoside phosphotransferase (APT) family kinase protein
MTSIGDLIKQHKYQIERFPTGLKNEVGRIVLKEKQTQYVLKKFAKKRINDVVDFYENEKNALVLLSDFRLIPRVIYSDDDSRFLIINFIQGSDLERTPQNSSEFYNGLEHAIKTLYEFNKYTITLNTNLKFRQIDLRKDMFDGLKILSEQEVINPGKLLMNAAAQIVESISTKDKCVIAHGSLIPGNIIYDTSSECTSFVDFELIARAPFFYDLGFLLSRTSIPNNQKRELVKVYAKLANLDSEQLTNEIDAYKTISNVLLMGLDTETINHKEDFKGIYAKRYSATFSTLNAPFSSNTNIENFVNLFNKSLLIGD